MVLKSPSYPLQHIPHRVGRFALGVSRDVGVGIQGEARAVMAQHSGDRLDVYAVLESQGRHCMSAVMETHLRQPRPLQDAVEHIQDTVRGDGSAGG